MSAPKWVRVGPKQWEPTDPLTGRSLRTGQPVGEWIPAREQKLIVSKSGKTRKAPPPKSEWKKSLKPSVIEFVKPADTNGETWGEREPYEAYQWARQEYLKGTSSIEAMHERTGFKVSQIRSWIYHNSKERDGWHEEKKVFQNQAVHQLIKDTKQKCLDLINDTLSVVETRINHLKENAEEGKALRVSEVRALVSALKDLHQVSQLEQEKPTSINQNAKMSHRDILERLKKSDPLINYNAADDEDESDTSKPTH